MKIIGTNESNCMKGPTVLKTNRQLFCVDGTQIPIQCGRHLLYNSLSCRYLLKERDFSKKQFMKVYFINKSFRPKLNEKDQIAAVKRKWTNHPDYIESSQRAFVLWT
jgi:hypothetical protein